MHRTVFATLCCLLLSAPLFAGSIDVSYVVIPVSQVKNMNCWAAATTMLLSWKRTVNMSMDDMVAEAGEPYATLYQTNAGIMPEDEANLYKKFGLQVSKQQNLSIQAWADLLTGHGPLSVTVDANPGNGFIHGLVMTGMSGDGSSDNTNITYNDPADGDSHAVSFTKFLALYQGSAAWPLQIIYW